MEYKKYTTSFYVDLLKKGEYFTYGKFGDGELIAIFKYLKWDKKYNINFGNHNIDRHLYYDDLGESLHNTFIHEKGYFKGCPNHWWSNDKPISRLFRDYVKEYNINPPNLHDTDTSFYKDAPIGNLGDLKNQLEKMNYIVVGDSKKRNLPIKYTDFIEIPSVNAWLKKDDIKEQILTMVEKYESPVFGLSAGMGTLSMQDDLYSFIGDKCWTISFGSIWDPYIGIKTRTYHKQYKTNKI